MKSVQGLRVDARGDSQRFVQSNGRNCVAISQDVRGGGGRMGGGGAEGKLRTVSAPSPTGAEM